MRSSIPATALILLSWGQLAAEQTAKAPPAPAIAIAEADALVKLARSAMVEYLAKRTPADEVTIPKSVQDLTGGVALSLRRDGQQVAECIQQDHGLARNVVAAALTAMRSPRLPDKVTSKLLEGLVVEIEVLGPPQKVEQADLAATIIPGMTGLRASRGLDDSFLLPSAAYLGSLRAEDIPRASLAKLPLRGVSASMPVRWAVFGASHYVGYPGGRTLWLYRGKTLLPPNLIDAKALSAAALQVGTYLLRSQDKDGQLTASPGKAPIADHLYATYALARLAKSTGRRDMSAGVNAALGYAMRFVEQQADFAYLKGLSGDEQVVGMSLLVLAIGQAPASEAGTNIRGRLVGGLFEAAKAAAKRTADANAAAPSPKAWSMALLAVRSATQSKDIDTAPFDRLIGASAAPDCEAAMWMLRAGVPQGGRPTPRQAWPVRREGGPLDEAGGFGPDGRSPTTVVTALAAVNLAAGKSWPAPAAAAPGPQAQASRQANALAARRFCYQMMVKPKEAYFTSTPERWVGGVRASPGGAAVTLPACAAAIEALLAE
ncbi:MAG TPA: AMMECR1 domain-containing protein [Phycisphaerae bacterium]|nr:AMMECR1 domain-containing protein [Phycisphaerae bacterium]